MDDDTDIEREARKPKRMDCYGNPIRKGGKIHRIVFSDNKMTNKPLSKVHIVESYKLENKIDKKYNIVRRNHQE